MKHKLLYLLPLSAALSGLTACTTVDEHERPIPGRAPSYEPRPVYSDYDYYFYPNVAVYFQISTGYYFYEDHGRWVRVRQLPPNIHLDSRYRRQLTIRDPYPYTRYAEHARQYGAREEDHDHRDDRGPGRDMRPMPPVGDRHEGMPGRPFTEDRQYRPPAGVMKPDERREPPPMENRGQERRDQVAPGRGQDDDRRGPKTPAPRRDDDKPRGYEQDRSKDGRPDARRPSQDEVSSQKARGREDRGESKDAAPQGRPEGSYQRGTGKQDEQGGRDRSPGGKDDDDDDRDRRGPWAR
jgi:hypothetical protein